MTMGRYTWTFQFGWPWMVPDNKVLFYTEFLRGFSLAPKLEGAGNIYLEPILILFFLQENVFSN